MVCVVISCLQPHIWEIITLEGDLDFMPEKLQFSNEDLIKHDIKKLT